MPSPPWKRSRFASDAGLQEVVLVEWCRTSPSNGPWATTDASSAQLSGPNPMRLVVLVVVLVVVVVVEVGAAVVVEDEVVVVVLAPELVVPPLLVVVELVEVVVVARRMTT